MVTLNSPFSFFYVRTNKGAQLKYLSCPKEAWAFYSDFKINLNTGKKTKISPGEIQENLKEAKLNKIYNRPKVFHIAYELNQIFYSGKFLKKSLAPLLIVIEYDKVEAWSLENKKDLNQLGKTFCKIFKESPNDKRKLKFNLSEISFKSYQNVVAQVMEGLQRGDCYQLNLTTRIFASWTPKTFHKILETLFCQERRPSSYAHATFCPIIDWFIVSNSPECLFQTNPLTDDFHELWSMPIKGTMPVKSNGERGRISKILLKDIKNENELNIIIDLVRNDLARIPSKMSFPKILNKKLIINVPNLVHLAAVIGIKVPGEVTLLEILAALFPGGSITGAPKLRVMEMIDRWEESPRSHYTGTTVLFWGDRMSASLNIRTLEGSIKRSEGFYGAGGGITLGSTAMGEYKELNDKVKSFFNLFENSGN